MLLLFAWVAAEAYSPASRQRTFVPPPQLEKLVHGAVLNVPVMKGDGYAALMQIFHHQPIATGYLARNSAPQRNQFLELREAFNRGGAKFCAQLNAMNIRNVLITPDANSAPYSPGTAPLELSKCAVNVVDLRNDSRDELNAGRAANRNGDEQPAKFPRYVYGARLDFASAHSAQLDPYLWYGWSGAEALSRWTERGAAAIVFALEHLRPCVLRIRLAPFLVPGKLDAQGLEVALNNRSLARLTLESRDAQTISIDVPVDALREENVIEFRMPDAAIPASLQVSEDARLLGINVQWIELEARESAK